MSFRNKILLINATLFLVFVGSLIYASVLLVKSNYDNQIEGIKSGIIGQNTRLVESLVKSQEALLEEKAEFILEEIKYLSLFFSSSCVQGYISLDVIDNNLKCINQVPADYIKKISFVDLGNNIEIESKDQNSSLIINYLPEYSSLWSSDKALKYKVSENSLIKSFYILQPVKDYPNKLLKFELDLEVFSRSLSIASIDGYKYRFFIIDNDGNLVASNLDQDVINLLNSPSVTVGNNRTLKEFILTEDVGFLTVKTDADTFNVIHRKNKTMNWRVILVTPESYLQSSYESTVELLLSSDNSLVEKIVFATFVLFILFLFLIYITIVSTFRPIYSLIEQANCLKNQDFDNAMTVVHHSGDEIELLSHAYSEAGRTIKALVEGLEEEVKHRTEQYENAAKEALDATNKKSTLLSNVSHEIRTPLNAIIGYLNMLQDDQVVTIYKRQLDGIKTASNTILNIVNDLLDFERLDALNYRLHPEYIMIKNIIRDIEKTFNPLANQKDITLSIKKNDINDLDRIYVDGLRFQQAISNIVSNAIKFTDFGDVIISISKEIFQNKKMIVFAIQDTGRGIKKDDMENIFNSFEQANQEDKQFGFGLGLAITQAIINLMGGILTVESQLGKGSVFKIFLPIDILSLGIKAPEKENEASETNSNNIDSFVGVKALVVDDVDFNREVLQFHLKEKGIDSRSAIDGVDALERLDRESFDIILTDVSMPNMDGIELAKRVRVIAPEIPVIAVTARATVQEEEKIRHHFDSYITKPIDDSELIRAMSLCLHN